MCLRWNGARQNISGSLMAKRFGEVLPAAFRKRPNGSNSPEKSVHSPPSLISGGRICLTTSVCRTVFSLIGFASTRRRFPRANLWLAPRGQWSVRAFDQATRDDHRLNFACSFEDIQNACVLKDSADRVLQRKTIASVDLNGVVSRRHRQCGRQAASPFPLPGRNAFHHPSGAQNSM